MLGCADNIPREGTPSSGKNRGWSEVKDLAADVNGRALSASMSGGASVPAGPDQGGCVSEEVFIDVSRMNAPCLPYVV